MFFARIPGLVHLAQAPAAFLVAGWMQRQAVVMLEECAYGFAYFPFPFFLDCILKLGKCLVEVLAFFALGMFDRPSKN